MLPSSPTIEAMLMTEPEPFSTMRGETARVIRNTPFRLTSSTASQSASLILWSMASFVMPALLTSTSIAPDSAAIRSTAAFTAAESVTSTTAPFTAGNAASRAANSLSFTSRAQTRFAPSRANVSTMPRPMPRAPPVTTHTLPFSRMFSPYPANGPHRMTVAAQTNPRPAPTNTMVDPSRTFPAARPSSRESTWSFCPRWPYSSR